MSSGDVKLHVIFGAFLWVAKYIIKYMYFLSIYFQRCSESLAILETSFQGLFDLKIQVH